jgi:aminoglycoside phosphotransferase (APT) family kinase protein
LRICLNDGRAATGVLASAGISGVDAMSRMTAGWSTTSVWKVEAASGGYALRLYQGEEAGVCQREARFMRLAGSHGIPVPGIRAEGIWNGQPYLLLDWISGETIVDAFRARPWRVRQIGRLLGETHADLNQIAVPIGSHATKHAWIDWSAPADDRIREHLLATDLRSDRLLHLDFHPLNILIDSSRISAVIDWTNARVGDPRADVARTLITLRYGPLDPATPVWNRALINIGRREAVRSYLRAYQRVAGPLRNMDVFLAWAAMATVRDLEPKLDRPEIPLDVNYLDGLKCRAHAWQHRAFSML